MARRKSKRSPRKSAKKLNILGVAEAVVVANAVTQGLFNTNAVEFITGRTSSSKGTGYFPSNADNIITLPELLGMDWDKLQQSSGNTPLMQPFSSVGAGEKIKQNLKNNGLMMGAQLVLIPLGFRTVTKLAASPRRQANKLLSYTGIGVKV